MCGLEQSVVEKKYFKNAQWLRNIKDKNYPFYRLDIFFSKTKYINMKFIENGGWHFSNIKTPEEIRYKLNLIFIMVNLMKIHYLLIKFKK